MQALEQSDNSFAVATLTVVLAIKKKKTDDNLLNLEIEPVRKLYARQFSLKYSAAAF